MHARPHAGEPTARMDDTESTGPGLKQRGGDPLAAMYMLAALLMAAAAGVVILLMFVPDGASSSADAADLWIPGSGSGWEPIAIERPDFSPPGLVRIGTLEYVAVVEAYNWVFRPSEIRIPVGATVTFRARSVDDYHGLAIMGTPIVISLPRSGTTEVIHTFAEPGEYPIVCAEYCGAGHVNMTGLVIVE